MSVAGLFFYGSFCRLFTDERSSASPVTGAILFKIPGAGVLARWRPLRPSDLRAFRMLHGMVAITAIMGLCLIQWEREQCAVRLARIVLLALPACGPGELGSCFVLCRRRALSFCSGGAQSAAFMVADRS